MKMNKKKVFTLALAVCLIAILSMSTLAWFNDSDTIVNEFMTSDSNGNGTVEFAVDVFETDGRGNRLEENKFPNITPNSRLHKDPTVENKGDYPMYTRVVVTLSDAAAWLTACARYGIITDTNDLTVLEKLVTIDSNWTRYDNPVRDLSGDTITYVYYYNHVLAYGAFTSPVFNGVTIPWQLQIEDMQFGGNNFTITVKADAIQSQNIIPEGYIITGNEAYTAFGLANWAPGAAYQPNP